MQRPVAIDPISPLRDPAALFGALDEHAVAAALVAATDIALVLSPDGVILDLCYNGAELAREGCATWIGRPWLETVAEDSRDKVRALLAASPTDGAPPARQVNHPSPRGEDLPVRYALTPLAGGKRLALGRELRATAALQGRLVEAQHAAEREYARLRDAEMRYRLLYQMSGEPLLIVDAGSRRIVEANPAAERLFRGARRLAGRPLGGVFSQADATALDRMIVGARSAGRAEGATVTVAEGVKAHASATLFRQEATAFALLRLTAEGADVAAPDGPQRLAVATLEAAPEAFVVTDPDGVISHANGAFLNLAQLATPEQAEGASLERFLGRPGVDLNILLSTLRDSGVVRLFATSLRGEFGSVIDAELCAVRIGGEEGAALAFLIRNVDQRAGQRGEDPLPRSVEQLTELVGRVPLKDLVRETTDVIERLCIEAALELTGDNRASAAEMLGLSRQSLYVKLRRYGLGDLDETEA